MIGKALAARPRLQVPCDRPMRTSTRAALSGRRQRRARLEVSSTAASSTSRRRAPSDRATSTSRLQPARRRASARSPHAGAAVRHARSARRRRPAQRRSRRWPFVLHGAAARRPRPPTRLRDAARAPRLRRLHRRRQRDRRPARARSGRPATSRTWPATAVAVGRTRPALRRRPLTLGALLKRSTAAIKRLDASATVSTAGPAPTASGRRRRPDGAGAARRGGARRACCCADRLALRRLDRPASTVAVERIRRASRSARQRRDRGLAGSARCATGAELAVTELNGDRRAERGSARYARRRRSDLLWRRAACRWSTAALRVRCRRQAGEPSGGG